MQGRVAVLSGALPRAFSAAQASPGHFHGQGSPQRPVRAASLNPARSVDFSSSNNRRSRASRGANGGSSSGTAAPGVPCSSEVAAWQAMRMKRMAAGVCSVAPSTVTLSSTASTTSNASLDDVKAPAPEPDVAVCDIRVGRILTCAKHPEADSLYVEQIDVGEAEPRTIVSGLAGYVPLEAMQERMVVVICNLKPRNMRGVKSNGMVLCASGEAHDVVEPLAPPPDAKVGERVWFGQGNEAQAAPAEPNRVQKKKLWEGVQPLLRTSAGKVAGFKGLDMLTSAGPVTVPTLANASIA